MLTAMVDKGVFINKMSFSKCLMIKVIQFIDNKLIKRRHELRIYWINIELIILLLREVL